MKRKNKAYENGGKGEILPRANIIKIALLLIIATIFSVAPLYAESKALQLNSRSTKNISKSSRGNSFHLVPSLAASAPKITSVKSVTPLVPKIKVSAPAIKTIAPSILKLNNSITVIPIAKVNNFKPTVLLIPKLNSFTPKVFKTNPIVAVPKKTAPLIPNIKITSAKINTFTPALKQMPVISFKQAKTLKLIPKQHYPVKLPKRGPIPLVPSRERQPVSPVLPSAPNNPISQPTGSSNAGSNTNSNNSGHNSANSGASFPTSLILGLFGHYPALSKRRMSKIISEISRRLKNGIGIIFGARSPNISQVDACNLAYVHQQGKEEILSNKLVWSQENCGLFCLFGAKKTL